MRRMKRTGSWAWRLAAAMAVLTIAARKSIRIEAENFRSLEGCEVESRNDRTASQRISVRLALGAAGRIQTRFDEPYAASRGRYHVEVRYSAGKQGRCQFKLCINGRQQGAARATRPAMRNDRMVSENEGVLTCGAHPLELRASIGPGRLQKRTVRGKSQAVPGQTSTTSGLSAPTVGQVAHIDMTRKTINVNRMTEQSSFPCIARSLRHSPLSE